MEFFDEVEVVTPSVDALSKAMKKHTFQGKWKIQRLSHLVSAWEETTQEIHLFNSNDPEKMAEELWLRDNEVFGGKDWK